MNEMLIGWLILLIICIIAEVATMGLVSIWFAGGALVTMILAAFNAPLGVQIGCFLVVSLLLLFFTRPIAVKYFNKDRVKTNAESLIGHQAIVTSEIDNLQAKGKVTVSGAEWSARSADADVKLPEGMVVEIVDIQGVKLIVKESREK